MGERTEYSPGTFSWVDLTTTDQEGAKAFYSGLFGWQADDRPVGDGVYYSMQQVDGHSVAAISAQPQQQRNAGVPPVWNSYVTVESADAAAERAAGLGATVHAPPFDVLDAGRMAVIQDPQGAFFMVWEPRENIGAGLVNAPGAFCWNELHSPDLDGSTSFYEQLFGWRMQAFEGMDDYFVIMNGERSNGGLRKLDQEGSHPIWMVYFATDHLEGSLAKVEQLGGGKHSGPTDIGIARIGVVHDPQGAWFLLYEGNLEE